LIGRGRPAYGRRSGRVVLLSNVLLPLVLLLPRILLPRSRSVDALGLITNRRLVGKCGDDDWTARSGWIRHSSTLGIALRVATTRRQHRKHEHQSNRSNDTWLSEPTS